MTPILLLLVILIAWSTEGVITSKIGISNCCCRGSFATDDAELHAMITALTFLLIKKLTIL